MASRRYLFVGVEVYHSQVKRSTKCLCGKTIPQGTSRVWVAIYQSTKGYWPLFKLVHAKKCALLKEGLEK